LVRDFPQRLWHETSADQSKLVETLKLQALRQAKQFIAFEGMGLLR
jgi:hypothetical protein